MYKSIYFSILAAVSCICAVYIAVKEKEKENQLCEEIDKLTGELEMMNSIEKRRVAHDTVF